MTDEQQPHPSVPGPTTPPAVSRLTVWHIPSPDQPGSLTADLARRLLSTFTEVGSTVVVLDDDPMLQVVAAAAGLSLRVLAADVTDEGHLGIANMVLLRWPRPGSNPQHLLQTARAVLRTGGHLAIAVQVPAQQRTAHLTALSGAAATAGFQPVQHIVAIAPCEGATGQTPRGSDASPHTDVLIFQITATRHE